MVSSVHYISLAGLPHGKESQEKLKKNDMSQEKMVVFKKSQEIGSNYYFNVKIYYH